MIFGCGIDIEETNRFNKHYFRKGKLSDLVYDLFTSKEIDNYSVFGKEAFLKGFSFKEAFYKAINNPDISFQDIEITFEDNKNISIHKSSKLDKIFYELDIIDIMADFEVTDQYVLSKVLLEKK